MKLATILIIFITPSLLGEGFISQKATSPKAQKCAEEKYVNCFNGFKWGKTINKKNIYQLCEAGLLTPYINFYSPYGTGHYAKVTGKYDNFIGSNLQKKTLSRRNVKHIPGKMGTKNWQGHWERLKKPRLLNFRDVEKNKSPKTLVN